MVVLHADDDPDLTSTAGTASTFQRQTGNFHFATQLDLHRDREDPARGRWVRVLAAVAARRSTSRTGLVAGVGPNGATIDQLEAAVTKRLAQP